MILATVLARGGSKGVPGKNKKMIAGKPLIIWTLEQIKTSGVADKIIVDSDDKELLAICEEWGVDHCMVRPDDLASDTASKVDALKYCVDKYEKEHSLNFDTILDLDVTSPLRSVEDIQGCLQLFKEKQATNVITGCPSRRSPYFNLVELNKDETVGLSKELPDRVVRRQDAPKTYDMNASIYVWDKSELMKATGVFLGKTHLYEMPEERSVDIDSPLDFKIVEALLKEANHV